MLAVTRLENVLCERGYPVPTNTTTYYRIGAREGVRTRPHTTTQGWKHQTQYLRFTKDLGLTKDWLQLQHTTSFNQDTVHCFQTPFRNDETTRPRCACAQVGKWFSPDDNQLQRMQ